MNIDGLGLVQALRNLSGIDAKINILEAFVTSIAPLKLECSTDNKLIISDSNLYPVSSRFSSTREKAIIYHKDNTSSEVEIEIDYSIKVGDLFAVIQVDNGETCRYLLIDRLGGGVS